MTLYSISVPSIITLCLLIDVHFILCIADIKRSFCTIADGIGVEWTNLAALLDPDIDVTVIKENNSQVFNQVISFLNKWYNKYPEASLGQLTTALKEIDRNDVVLTLGLPQN